MSPSIDEQGSIQLRDIDAESNYSLLNSTKITHPKNPFNDEIASITSTVNPPLLATLPFIPTVTLQIQAEGKTLIALPSAPNQTTIPIFAPHVSDRPKYLAIRPARRSGTFFLTDAEDEEQKPLSRVVFKFGPMRPPIMYLNPELDEENNEGIEIQRAVLSHSVTFTSPEHESFEWRYAGRRERAMVGKKINNLLVLERIGNNGKRKKIAQLIRCDETRTPGTRARDAGNGGRLEIVTDEEDNEIEVLVVTTCLVMLKKEIDRMRGWQMAATRGYGVWK